MTNNYDILEDSNYVNDEYFLKVAYRYYHVIGEFITDFSYLESTLNDAIADCLNADWVEEGFLVMERLTFGGKVDLFNKLYLRKTALVPLKNKDVLLKIRDELSRLNTFRNSVAHADWQSLSKDGTVRTKIVVDGEEGYVKFKRVPMTPKLIRENIKAIGRLMNKLDNYVEKSNEF